VDTKTLDHGMKDFSIPRRIGNNQIRLWKRGVEKKDVALLDLNAVVVRLRLDIASVVTDQSELAEVTDQAAVARAGLDKRYRRGRVDADRADQWKDRFLRRGIPVSRVPFKLAPFTQGKPP